jgi:hypothetical protein
VLNFLRLIRYRSLCFAVISPHCYMVATCQYTSTSKCILRVFHPSSRAFLLPLLISKREGKLIDCFFYHRTPKFMN